MASSKSSRVRLTPPAPLPDRSHYRTGRFDNAHRWHPADEYRVAGTFRVRPPSRAWPYSYLKHYYTRVYARALALADLRLYCQAAGIPIDSDRGRELVAWVAAQRIGGAA